MVYKIYKLFLKIVSSFKLILLNIIFVSTLFLYGESAFSNVTNIENYLAYKYCDSLEKNLFKGLDNERILKYEYFFDSVNFKALNEELEKTGNFSKDVETICSYKLSIDEKEDMNKLIKKFYLSNKK